LERTKNRPNEDNLTDSPPIKASASSSNTDCTRIPDSLQRYTASARSTRVTVRGAVRRGPSPLSSAADNPSSSAARIVSDFVIFNPVNLFQSCGIELIRQEPTLLRPTKETITSGVQQEFFSSIRQQGVVICGRPRLARGFMSVCARRSGAVICPAFVRGSYGRWP